MQHFVCIVWPYSADTCRHDLPSRCTVTRAVAVSWKFWRQVRNHPDTTQSDLLVAAELASHMNTTGTCWPSIPTMADHLGMKRETVRASLRRLEGFGLVSVRWSKGGRGNTHKVHAVLKQVPQGGGFPGQTSTPGDPLPDQTSPLGEINPPSRGTKPPLQGTPNDSERLKNASTDQETTCFHPSPWAELDDGWRMCLNEACRYEWPADDPEEPTAQVIT